MNFEKHYFLHNKILALRYCMGLLLLLQCLSQVVCDDDDDNSILPESSSELPVCNSNILGSQMASTTRNMLKYMDKCDQDESEKWRKTWMSSTEHSYTNAWHNKVCNFFSMQMCNGTHCICGDKATFGADLEYKEQDGPDKNPCLAKEMEPCSDHGSTSDMLRELKVTTTRKKSVVIRQYLVPATAWGTHNCTPKVDLHCLDDSHWCKPVNDESQKRLYHTRCLLKDISESGHERFQFSNGLTLLFNIVVIGITFQQ